MSSTPASVRSGRGKQTKIIVLRLPQDRLAVFAPEKRSAKPSVSKTSSTPSTPTATKDSPAAEPGTETKDETPNGNVDGLQASAGGRKGSVAAKPPLKRGASAINDGLPKPRSKPGPKRRKIEAAFGGEEPGKPWTQSAPMGGHKLGPKANQGAINAGLRALDRSGAPCRKWNKSTFAVKSFTGIVWSLPTWSAPKREESKEQSGDAATPNSNGEPQAPASVGNVEADTTQINGTELNGNPSSPAPIAAAS